VPFHVEADDDHRDLVVAAKGKSAFIEALPATTKPLPGARLLIRRR
jgi:hypothetical protein